MDNPSDNHLRIEIADLRAQIAALWQAGKRERARSMNDRLNRLESEAKGRPSMAHEFGGGYAHE